MLACSVVFGERCVQAVGRGVKSVAKFVARLPVNCKRCVCYFAVRMFVMAAITCLIVLLVVLKKEKIY